MLRPQANGSSLGTLMQVALVGEHEQKCLSVACSVPFLLSEPFSLRASTSSFCCCFPGGAAWQLGKACQTHCSFPGLQQQGIFRVPGSQVEVNDIKNSFERGAWAGCVVQLGRPGLTPLPVLWGGQTLLWGCRCAGLEHCVLCKSHAKGLP